MCKVNNFKRYVTLFCAVCIFALPAFIIRKPVTHLKAADGGTKPEDNRFVKTILANDLNEPMQLAVANDGRVFFIERIGNFYVYNPSTKKTTLVRKFPVKLFERYQNGMLGITIDPDFSTNGFIYFFFSANADNAPDKYEQHLSRFTISKSNVLDLKSEKVVLRVPIDMETSAHVGSSMAWDKNRNLFLSTGDNTPPSGSDGSAPIDRRPGRMTMDAERSAGNTNDLRGKILRIHPEADGTYTIPTGNLFAKGTPKTKPEIYVMGCRNPYRITVDQESSTLYWGEIGPDAGQTNARGSRGYDEINQAKKAGFYGWPYFIGDNQPYHEYDFENDIAGKAFDVNGAENASPHNTGARILPPAQKAFVWYPYEESAAFPVLGKGTRCIIGGPMYHYDKNLKSKTKFPGYYDKVLFVGEYMRNWIIGIRVDENQNYKSMEPFMETNGDFRRPIDMKFGPEGSFYMLEYGSGYGLDNADARLVRIDYNEGNRAPVAKIVTKDTIGHAPFKVALNQKSFDADNDKLTYSWVLNGKTQISAKEAPVYTFTKNGIYKLTLKVTDAAGKTGTDTKIIKVGNSLPQVSISTNANDSFFFPGTVNFDYDVVVADHEDKIIDPKRVKVAVNYIAKVESGQVISGHQDLSSTYNYGKALMAKSDCKACHLMNTKSAGPALMEVAKKYAGNKEVIPALATKVISGGSGAWGEASMSAHPQLSMEDASEIVSYILTLNDKPRAANLPQKGSIALKDHLTGNGQGRYIITASYTDKGGAITPLTTTRSLVLRPAKVQAEDADEDVKTFRRPNGLAFTETGSYFMLKDINLKGINRLIYNYSSRNITGTIEVHTGSPKGPVISKLDVGHTGDFNSYKEQSALVKDPGAKSDLYFVFTKLSQTDRGGAGVDWVSFEKGK